MGRISGLRVRARRTTDGDCSVPDARGCCPQLTVESSVPCGRTISLSLSTFFRDVANCDCVYALTLPLPIVYHTLVHLQTMSSPRASSVRIEPVSEPSELHTLASVFDMATRASGDKFREVLMRYVEDPYKETMKHLEAAQSAEVDEHSLEQHFLFKAVMTVPKHSAGDCKELGWGMAGGVLPETPTEEKIEGMAHWTVGYINLPKVDPFEQQTVASLAPATTDEPFTEATPLREPIATGAETIADSKPKSNTQPFDFYAVCRKPVRNTYISQIRGKKHVCKSCPMS